MDHRTRLSITQIGWGPLQNQRIMSLRLDRQQRGGTRMCVYADADFACCLKMAKSTSGVVHFLMGSNSSFQLAASSKKQHCVSHYTPEAEFVAAKVAVRCYGLPGLTLCEHALKGTRTATLFGDDNAMIKVLETGTPAAMLQVGRTQSITSMATRGSEKRKTHLAIRTHEHHEGGHVDEQFWVHHNLESSAHDRGLSQESFQDGWRWRQHRGRLYAFSAMSTKHHGRVQ